MDSLLGNNGYVLQDFIDDPNFDQFIDLIRGEIEHPVAGFDCKILSVDDNDQFGDSALADMFDFNHHDLGTMASDLSYVLNSVSSSLNRDIKARKDEEDGDNDDDDDDEDNSSGTTRTTKSTKSSKIDRSRTLVSERKRRGRMKEKLYALRALVPTITKMDKASIIGDAVLYVQDLQMQAKKLKTEISGLESSLVGADQRYQESTENQKRAEISRRGNHPICKKIMQMDVYQVEERGFYLRIVSNKGEGVAVSLHKALETLTSFNVQNSNLATVSERFVLTSTLNVKNCERIMNLPNLKLWITGALLNQGFQVLTPLSV